MTRHPGIRWAAAVLAMTLSVTTTYAQVCSQWQEAAQIGTLQDPLKEASGVAASRRFPGRLYHINDSGSAGNFYVTDMAGNETRAVTVQGFKPRDTEALSLASCGAGRSCLFIGDIGDNNLNRQSIDIAIVEELENFPLSVKPRQLLKLRYPDGPHDAESMAVLSDGSILLLTKESPARLFKANVKPGMQTMMLVMTLDVQGRPTDMAISDDGTRLLVLTYLDATEFGIDFSRFSPPLYRQKIPIQFLQQQEAATYLPGSRSFIYTSEQFVLPAWIMRVDCKPL